MKEFPRHKGDFKYIELYYRNIWKIYMIHMFDFEGEAIAKYAHKIAFNANMCGIIAIFVV